jgi:hypothetical protein
MKTFHVIVLTFIFAVAGCSGDKVNLSALKPAASKSAGKLTIVLLNKSCDLMQGQNESSLLGWRAPARLPRRVPATQRGPQSV